MVNRTRSFNNLLIYIALLLGLIIPTTNHTANAAESRLTIKSFILEEFTALESDLSAEILVQRGDKWHMTLEGEARILPLIDVINQNGTLKIAPKTSFSTQRPLRVTLTTPHIERAILRGSGELRLESVEQQDLELRLDGAGTIEAAGTVDRLHGTIGGSGELRLKGISALAADVAIAGSGTVEITARESLTATITGSGEVVYYGEPSRVSEQITGAGIVSAGQ